MTTHLFKCGSIVGLMASSALASSCCPEEAWSQLEADSDYVEKGVIERVDDIDIYRVGNSSKCIVWNYDIFGFNSGRTRQFADIFADQGDQDKDLYADEVHEYDHRLHGGDPGLLQRHLQGSVDRRSSGVLEGAEPVEQAQG